MTHLPASSGCRRGRPGRMAVLLAAAAAAGLTALADAATVPKVTILNGDQEVLPVPTPATGCGRFRIDTAANRLEYHIAFSGLLGPESVAHLHGPAAIGATAAPVHTLPAGNPKTGFWSYPEAMEADILAGLIYVNIHSSAFPAGEIRGQVVDMVAIIDGPQAATPSPASGWGLFNLDTCGNALRYHIEYTGVVETAAHIHGFALHGVGAGVKHPLPAGSPKVGAWSFSEDDEARLRNGETYVNIHSGAFPGGEIRGQIVSIVAPLDGAQEVPPSGATGHGCGLCGHDDAGNALSYHLSHPLITATAAHIHGFAPPGANAGIQHNVGTANPAVGTWSYAAADKPDILAGRTYFNVHTAANPGGEVRGQILFPGPVCLTDLDCSGATGFNDLLTLLADWGGYAPCPPHKQADFDQSCAIGFNDLLTLLANWGPCP